jgi:predicted PurR-regulated permease PerM
MDEPWCCLRQHNALADKSALVPASRALELSVRQKANTWFLFALAALALYLSYLVAQPFLNAIFAAVVLAVVFHPLHARMIHISARRPNLAATITTVLVILMVAIPAVVLGIVVTRELGDLYRLLGETSAARVVSART